MRLGAREGLGDTPVTVTVMPGPDTLAPAASSSTTLTKMAGPLVPETAG